MRSRGVQALCALVIGLVPFALVSEAQANQVPGATYTGSFWGEFDGASYSDPISGTLEFDVSPDGATVTRFEVTDVEPRHAFVGDLSDCTPMSASYTTPLPISSDEVPTFRLDGGVGAPFTFDGYFERPAEASGRVQVIEEHNGTNCYTGGEVEGSIHWTASTAGGCKASPQYKDLEATVNELRAQAAAAKAKFKKAKAKYAKAVDKLRAARADLKAAETDRAKEKAKKAIKEAYQRLRTAERKKRKAARGRRDAIENRENAEAELALLCG